MGFFLLECLLLQRMANRKFHHNIFGNFTLAKHKVVLDARDAFRLGTSCGWTAYKETMTTCRTSYKVTMTTVPVMFSSEGEWVGGGIAPTYGGGRR